MLHSGHHVMQVDRKTITEIIFGWLPVARQFKAVLRAAAITDGFYRAGQAFLADMGGFTLAKRDILRRIYHFSDFVLVDISKLIFRIDKMVAGIDITIGFNN